jgi:branched-chain amino acid transport system permease protein
MLENQGEKWIKRRMKPSIYGLAVLLFALLPLIFSSNYVLYVVTLIFVYIIAAESFRIISISGQFPLAHGAFLGLGAYFSAMASNWLNWPPYFAIPAAAVATMVVGIIIGYPFSRLRAFYYAMGTLFFGIGVVYIIEAGGKWTGGYSGMTDTHPIFTSGSNVAYYYFFLGLAVVSCIAMYRFEFSRIGMNLKAIAQSPLVASSIGINESFYRVLAVAVGCFFVGLAGAAYAPYNMVLSPTSFSFMTTLWIAVYVIVGGIRSFAGPIIGTVIMMLIPEFSRGLKLYAPYVSVAILALVVYLMPDGLVSLPRLVRGWYSGRRKGEKIAPTT